MQRKDTKYLGRVNPDWPEKGWDPQTEAMYCMNNFSDAVVKCNADAAIQAAACVFGKAEAAFYEGQITEELMDEIKKDVFQPALRFSDKCKCVKK